MEFTHLIQNRACVRAYSDTPVTKEQITSILEAAILAPNACNFQSWHFYAVTNKDIIRAFHPNIARIPWIDHISCLLVVACDEQITKRLVDRFGEQGRMFVHQDAAGAINHMLLACADMGLGGCWIGPMDTTKCKKLLSMPEHHSPLAIVTIGVPADPVIKRARLPLSEKTTFIE